MIYCRGRGRERGFGRKSAAALSPNKCSPEPSPRNAAVFGGKIIQRGEDKKLNNVVHPSILPPPLLFGAERRECAEAEQGVKI